MSKPIYDMSGRLWVADKEGNPKRPDFKGRITVKGVEYEIAGWENDGDEMEYINLKVSELRRQDVSGQVPATLPSKGGTKTPTAQRAKPQERYEGGIRQDSDNFDDDIPF